MQDLGAAGLTCALAELTARGGVGAEVDLDAVPRREPGMTPYEVLLSESQERMLIVVRPDRVDDVRTVFEHYELQAARIGTITDGPLIRCHASGELVCEVPGRALADDAPRYDISGHAPPPAAGRASSRWRQHHRTAEALLELLASPERARPQADLAALRPHERHEHAGRPGPWRRGACCGSRARPRALALAIDGPGPARVGALDPYRRRRVGRDRGRAQRGLRGRHAGRHHRLPQLRLTRDRPGRLAARARHRRHRRQPAASSMCRSSRGT